MDGYGDSLEELETIAPFRSQTTPTTHGYSTAWRALKLSLHMPSPSQLDQYLWSPTQL